MTPRLSLSVSSTISSRLTPALLAVALATAGLTILAPPTQAADPCTDAGGTLSQTGTPDEYICSFGAAGSYTFTPPANAINIRLDAYGARGGGTGDGTGGLGAYAGGNFGSSLAGVELTFISGGAGRAGGANGTFGDGGYPNGGDGGPTTGSAGNNVYAGGGGGGSSVTSADGTQLVAGGGGGNGGNFTAGAGGPGGNAGATGGRSCQDICGNGGGGATTAAAGAGGARLPVTTGCYSGNVGSDGDGGGVGVGGTGGVTIGTTMGFSGGGGGGGYHGGGGGSGGSECSDPTRNGAGGGGGGGSSYVAPTASSPQILEAASAPNPNLPGGRGNVSITYVVPTAPTVLTANAPTTLDGKPFTVTFSRPVKGVTTNSVTVTRMDAGLVAGKLTCRDATNSAVNCGNGPVTTARFTAASPLIAGEYYDIDVNESSPTVVGHDSGLTVAPSTTQVRAQSSFTAFDYPITYKWARVNSAKALGGSFVRDASAGSTATATIKLQSASTPRIVLWGGPAQGIATVAVTKKGASISDVNVDTYRQRVQQLRINLGALASGTYKVKVTVTGTKNTASNGVAVGIDGVIANGKTTANPKLAVMWPNYPGEYAYDYTKRTSASLTFRGTGIDWTAVVGPNNGIAKVTIDGVVVDSRDLYAPGYFDQTFGYAGLSQNSLHTIVISCSGTKSASSTDTVVTLKGLAVQ
jgi:hypothetical protein